MCCPVGFFEDYNAVFHWKYLKFTPKMTNLDFPNFQKFYAFLLVLKFRQTSCIGMFLRVNKEKVRCPVVFYE